MKNLGPQIIYTILMVVVVYLLRDHFIITDTNTYKAIVVTLLYMIFLSVNYGDK